MTFRSRARRSLSKNHYTGETVKGDFRNGLAEECVFTDMTFEDSPMDRCSFFRSLFVGCTFNRCRLNEANFNGCSFKEVSFHGCELDMAGFRSALFDTVSIIGGRAEYATFDGVGAKDVLLDTQLHGADLRFHGAHNVDYGSSNLWGATVKMGCKQWAGATLDRRSIEILIGLIAKTKGNDAIREKLRGIISERSAIMIDKLTLSEL